MVVFEDLERIRGEYCLSKEGICAMLEIKITTYYAWCSRGISEDSSLQPLLKLFIENPIPFIEQHAKRVLEGSK